MEGVLVPTWGIFYIQAVGIGFNQECSEVRWAKFLFSAFQYKLAGPSVKPTKSYRGLDIMITFCLGKQRCKVKL